MSVLTDAGRSAWGFLSRTDRPVGWWDTECCMCPQTLLFSQSTRWTTSTAYGSRNGVKCFSEMGGYFFWTSPRAANLSPDFTYTPEHSHGSFARSDAPTAAAPQQKWAQQHAACPGFSTPVQSMSLFPRAWLKLHTASSRRVSGITCRHTEVILKKKLTASHSFCSSVNQCSWLKNCNLLIDWLFLSLPASLCCSWVPSQVFSLCLTVLTDSAPFALI